MSNTGKPFELLIQKIYTRLLQLEGLDDIVVHHNVTLSGKTTTHQIDVYWCFRLAGIEHQVVIQAKDWARSVEQGEVLLFQGVLNDLPGQPRGIIISRSGFQQGALSVAQAHGIELYELRNPSDADFEGRIKAIVTKFHFLIPKFRVVEVVVDQDWLSQQSATLSFGVEGDGAAALLRDSAGHIVETMQSAAHRMLPSDSETFDWRDVSYEFPAPTYLDTGDPEASLIKIVGLRGQAMRSEVRSEVTTSYESLYTLILRSVTNSDCYLVDRAGQVHRRP